MNPPSSILPSTDGDDLAILNTTFVAISEFILSIPGSAGVLRYIKTSYQDDPFRVVLELILVFFAIQYMSAKKYKIDDNAVKLTSKEIDELVTEWTPEPLVPPLSDQDRLDLEKSTLITGAQGPKPRVGSNQKPLLNLASANYLGLCSSDRIKEKAVQTLREYGVGSCGPPGFYGTIDVHMDLERNIAQFLGVEEAIIYAQGFSTISSVVPAFAKRGDVIVVW
ncbi:serine palmitoyltransferase, partial [Jimgerdemannia flammicorona]